MKKIFESKGFREFLRILIVITIGLGLGFIITLFVSEEPIEAYKTLLLGPVSRLNRIGDWLEESLTLILAGLAISIVFNAKQWYIGVEGQMILGALASGVVALYLPIPPFWRILIAIVAGMLTGFLWAVIPAVLKAYLNANELVTSLMLNTVALRLFEFFLKNFIMPEKARSVSSDLIGKEYRMSTFIPDWPFLHNIRELWIKQTSVSYMVYFVIAAVIIVYFLLYKTPFGYELRTMGTNTKFAFYGGVNIKKTMILSMTVSGIFAGLAGVHLSLAIHNKLIMGMSSGLGFEGIIVSTLASNNPLGIPLAGLLYGYLKAGADVMERTTDVSRELVSVIQAMVMLLITAERILPSIQRRIAEKAEENNKAGTEAKNKGESNVI